MTTNQKWEESKTTQDNAFKNPAEKPLIAWKNSLDKLLEVFDVFHENEIMPRYSTEEIMIHFVDEKRIPYCTSNKPVGYFLWFGSDSLFAVFVDELAKLGLIDDESKFTIFSKHFLNKKGKEFNNLSQKKNYTKNYTQSGNLIRHLLSGIFD